MWVSRSEPKVQLLVVAALMFLVAGCGGGEAGTSEESADRSEQATEASPEQAAEANPEQVGEPTPTTTEDAGVEAGDCAEGSPTSVKVGVTGTASDAQLYIADSLGYFDAQGIDPEFVPFDSGARMIAPLGGGELDVAAGAPSAGLYNAAARGIGLKIVADKARVKPDEPAFITFVVRSDLVESGQVQDPKDLEGLTFAHPAQGSTTEPSLHALTEEYGVDYGAIEATSIGFSEQISAFENGSIDASLLLEPFLTRALEEGIVQELWSLEEVYPNQQNAVLMYSERFAEEREVATCFLMAYLQGIEFYNDGVEDGRFGGETGEQIIDVLLEYTEIDRETLEKMRPPGMTGEPNVESLESDFQFFEDQGRLEGDVQLEDLLDTSYVEEARSRLGS